MAETREPYEQIRSIAELMRARLRIRGKSLGRQLHHGKRHLPKRLRGYAQILAAAEPLAAHPKARLLIDQDRLSHAENELRDYLIGLSIMERRKGWILSALGGFTFNLLLFAALLLMFLRWRGMI